MYTGAERTGAGASIVFIAVAGMLAAGAALGSTTTNHLFYDGSGPRRYFPWDLDTTMKGDYDVFDGTVAGGTGRYVDVLFSQWEGAYATLLRDLLAGPLSLAAIHAELDRAGTVAGAALDGDAYAGGGSAGAIAELAEWWSARHPAVSAQVMAP